MALYSELPIYKHGCDLLALALDVQVQLPRVFKRTLGEKIHALCVDMLEQMAMANASRGQDRVQQIDKLLQHLRAVTAMLRISHDKRLISPKLWAASVELLDVFAAGNSYMGLLTQATHSQQDRATVAKVLLGRGHAVNGALTKIYRRKS